MSENILEKIISKKIKRVDEIKKTIKLKTLRNLLKKIKVILILKKK